MAGSPDGDIVLKVKGRSIGGWNSVRVKRSIEQTPAQFVVGVTERDPSGRSLVVNVGEACEVWLGADRVLTGYVNCVVSSSDPNQPGMQISGRGKCQDLVDCSAEWPTAQISGVDAFELARKLAAPYGIDVRCTAPMAARQPAFNVTLTEIPFALIEEMARYYQCLVYEDVDGALLLAPVGQVKAASGMAEPGNVQVASVTRSDGERFSEYLCYLVSTQSFSDVGGLSPEATETDPNVRRHRRRTIIAEAATGNSDIPRRRAAWERNRRAGRSEVAVLTVDSWRDAAGKLWTPNTLVPLSLPRHHLAGVEWILGEVDYVRDAEGTRAEVILMAPQAFSPEPILLMPLIPDLQS